MKRTVLDSSLIFQTALRPIQMKSLGKNAADQITPPFWNEKTKYFLIVVLVALIPVQALTSIRWKSATFEEGVHLAAGAYYLETGNYDKIPGYPPLTRMWLSLPAWLSNAKIPDRELSPLDMYPFEFGARFLYEYNDADFLLFQGRSMVVILSMLLGFYVFRMTKDLFGWNASIIALVLYVFCPNILAHSRLATLDLPLTAFFFITLFYYRRALIRPDNSSMVLSGVFAFLTINAKYTGLILFPVLCSLTIAHFIIADQQHRDRHPLLRSWKIFAFVCFFSIFLVNLEYSFQGSFESIQTYHVSLPKNHQNRMETIIPETFSKLPVLSSIPLPIPHEYFRGLDMTIYYDLNVPHPNWYFGKRYSYGEHWWHYYITAMTLKLPVAFLITILIALIVGVTACVYDPGKIEVFLFLFIPIFIFFLYFSLVCHSQLGLRLILPIFPFLFAVSGFSTQYLLQQKRPGFFLLSFLMIWYIFSSVTIFPHYLSYFNEIAGGPDRGSDYFADSNLDWGQDLKGLKKYMTEKGIKQINLIYYGPNGTFETNYYDIKLPQKYEKSTFPWAISATWLYYAEDNFMKCSVPFSLTSRKPDDRIGYSINVYLPEKK